MARKFIAMLSAFLMLGTMTACGAVDSGTGNAGTDTNTNANADSKTDDSAKDDAAAESKADDTSSGGKQTVGIAMPTKSLERWNRDGEYLKDQFEAAGYNVELKYSDDDPNQQNNDIQGMIADKVDLLLIAAVNGNTLSQTLSDAKDEGIEVIAYDRLIMNTDAVDYYVSFDNYTVGKLQGEYVKKELGLDKNAGPFNIEFTAGDPADNNAPYFFNGAYETLKEFIDAGKLTIPSGKEKFEQVATEGWSTDTALENMQNTLASYYADGTQLDVALCSNDSTALGVAQAIASDYSGSNAPLVTGQDGDIANLKNIVDGKQSMTVYKNVSDEAGVTLEVSKAVLSGQTPDASLVSSLSAEAAYDIETYDNGKKVVPSYLLVPYVITKDNLDLLVDTGLYKWDSDHKYLESTASTT